MKNRQEPQISEARESIEDCSDLIKAGRGTSFVPPSQWLEAQDKQPDLLIYFTDVEGEFPPEPLFPVLWLVKGEFKVPWGRGQKNLTTTKIGFS